MAMGNRAFTVRCWVLNGCLSLLALAAFSASAETDISKLPPPAAKQVDFVADIRPIFEQSCLRCHGPERPKSGFRLDNRESALKGGAQGVAIIPGESAKSPLVHFVARLNPDLAMPPEDKGDPLTAEQIALLRAWIDQGAVWGGEETSRYSYTLTPAVGFVAVDGNESKFREHQWLRDGWRSGLESFEFWQSLSPETKFTLRGHAMTDDYRVEGLLEKSELGFVRLGFEQFRKYDSDTGGYVPGLGSSAYSLDRNVHLDSGRVWLDLGLTLPDWPRLALGYEYQYRDGEKATLQWGPVGTLPPEDPNTDARNIFPALKAIDEHTHILKFDLTLERGGWRFEDSFRGEWTESRTRRDNVRSLSLGTPDVMITDTTREGWTSFRGANVVRVEREFRDWLHGSAGYLYSHLSADAEFSLDTANPTGAPILPPVVQNVAWYSQRILLERESHVANANALFGPWAGSTFTLGVQAEWTRQEGTAEGFYDTIATPDFDFLTLHDPVNFIADLDKASVDEHVALRFTRLPFTTLFAEARLQQECLGHREAAIYDHSFNRDTDAESDSRDFRIGFDSSPRIWLKFGSQYRHYNKDTTFTDGFADDQAGDIGGYPTFIKALDRTTQEIESRLTLRPVRWLTTTFTHRLVATDYHTTTEPLAGFDPDPGTDVSGFVSPGGRVLAGNYDAQIFSFSATLTPWRRLHWFNTVSFQDVRSIALHDHSNAVMPYRGETWSIHSHGRYVLTQKTDVTAGYTFSTADFRQRHFAEGLPVGMDYDLHGVQAGLVSRRSKNLTLKLQYGFYRYDEPSSGGVNDYTAHAVLAAVTLRLP